MKARLTGAVLAPRLALYLVADPDLAVGDLPTAVESALKGGVTAVQLRAKRLVDREALALARVLRELCAERDALFVVNDRLDLALAAGADGVHLGVDDLPLADARRIAGNRLIIGYSPETDLQAVRARTEGADYLGVGPVFATASKADAGDAIGPGLLGSRARLAGVPVIGIGGVNATNAQEVIAAGAVGVAVIGAVLGGGDPEENARRLAAAVASARRRPSGERDVR